MPVDPWYHIFFLWHFVIGNKFNSFSSFCIEFLSGVHATVFPLLWKQQQQNRKRSPQSSVRPAVVYVLYTGQGQEYSVSVSVQDLKNIYIKWAGTRHNNIKVIRSVRISAKTDKSLCYVFNGQLKTQTVYSWTAIILIRLCGQPGWCVSLQGAQVILLDLS